MAILRKIYDVYLSDLNLSERCWLSDMLQLTYLTDDQKIELWRIRNKLDI